MGRAKKKSTQMEKCTNKCPDKKDYKKREPKKCARCKLHGKLVYQNKNHSKICQFLSCPNFLCQSVTRLKQLAMKVQQDTWRKRGQYIPSNKEKDQLCDKCRNHMKPTKKKNHEINCKFNSCTGILCRFSDARRKIMSFFLKIERSDILCDVFQSNYEKLIETGGKYNLNSSCKIVGNIKMAKEPYMDDETIPRNYTQPSKTYPKVLNELNSTSYLEAPACPTMSTPTPYMQNNIYQPQNVWCHSNPNSLDSSLFNYSYYNKYALMTDSLKYPEYESGGFSSQTTSAMENIIKSHNGIQHLHRPWIK